MTTALTKHQPQHIAPQSLEDLKTVAKMYAASGYFQDVRELAQACVKISAGAELGLTPCVSMTGINIIKGRVTLSAQTMASCMKRAGYKLKTKFATDSCTITVIDPDGEELGESSFSLADAKRAGLSGGNWQKYPRNMLFARAVSNAARWFAPEVLTGVYTPEEMGEDGPLEETPPVDIVDAEIVEQTKQGKPDLPPSDLDDTGSYRAFIRNREELAQQQNNEPPPVSDERKAKLRGIHAAAKEHGLDHEGLKQLLPEEVSFKTCDSALLESLGAVLNCSDLDNLKRCWHWIKEQQLPTRELEQLKDWLKAKMSQGQVA